MKMALMALLVALLAIAWRLNSTNATLTRQQQTLTQQQRQIQTLTTALADRSKQETAALQEKCAAQAERFFRSFVSDARQGGNNRSSFDYANHYQTRLDKCFVALLSNAITNREVVVGRLLFDAYERKELAEYYSVFPSKAGSAEKMLICSIFNETGESTTCSDRAAYEAFVKRFME